MTLPSNFNRKLFSSWLLTCENLSEANEFFNKCFPSPDYGYKAKYGILNELFVFNMASSYVPEWQSEEDKAKTDYLFTLQYLLDKAEVDDIEQIMKPQPQV